jgi:hypothetical protein
MKKSLVFATLITGMLLTACGGEEKTEEKEAKKCETNGGEKVACEDMEAIEKVDEMSSELVRLGIGDGFDYAKAIETNEAIFKKMEPHMAALERVLEADPTEKESYYVEAIENAKANTEQYKNIIADLKTISISASWGQDLVFEDEMGLTINFKNNTSNVITYLGGTMAYLDAEGNKLVEDEIGLYSFHFKPKNEDGMPAGFEGVSDHGINATKEQLELIDSVTISIVEIRYPDPESD